MAKVKCSFITTIDNPYDPYKEFDKWNYYDTQKGYHSNALLARVLQSSENFGFKQQVEDIDYAINKIIKTDVTGLFIKVVHEIENPFDS